MSDDALRSAQRRFERSGLLADEAAWFRERLRVGELTQAQLPALVRRVLDPDAALVLRPHCVQYGLPLGAPQLGRVRDWIVARWSQVACDGSQMRSYTTNELYQLDALRADLAEAGGELVLCGLEAARELLDAIGEPWRFATAPNLEAALAERGWRAALVLEVAYYDD